MNLITNASEAIGGSVLLDLSMPKLDGEEVFAELRLRAAGSQHAEARDP